MNSVHSWDSITFKKNILLDALIKMRDTDWCEKLYNIKGVTPVISFLKKKVDGFNIDNFFAK